MSDARDPFPMSSPEAQQLASSVDASLSNWGSMNTQSAGQGPTSMEAQDGADDSLIKSKTVSGDIYADIDHEDNEDDDYMDVPLTELRGSRIHRATQATLRTLKNIYTRLYGDKLPPSEMLRTLTLSMTLFFMIGGYWILRSLKDPILTALCGVSVIPKAKMLSVFVVLGVVSIYNRLLDSDLPRHKLFYIFGSFYCVLFTFIALLLKHPTIGLSNAQPSAGRILGWLSYCSIESFGSVMVSLFWSFANSNFSLETAKASYGVMVACAQVGSITGPTIVNRYASTIGVANCYLLGVGSMVMLQFTMVFYIRTYGTHDRNGVAPAAPKTKKSKAGVLEGLELFWKYNYIKGIFAISTLFMVEGTIIDYTMKFLARDYFAGLHPCERGMSCYNAKEMGMSHDATAAFTAFMGLFGQTTNTLSLLLSLFGTSAIIRYLGLRLTLLLFPTLCLGIIICVRINPTLYVVFAAMMLLKACSYALNNPTKEILYQPTSPAVRYKAKSWIDIFGARGSKAAGSVVTNAFSDSAANLVANGSLVAMAVASFLIWNARYMGKTFDEYMASGFIVGEEEDENLNDHVQLSGIDGEEEDTSCAIAEDDDDDAEVKGNEEHEESKGSRADVAMV